MAVIYGVNWHAQDQRGHVRASHVRLAFDTDAHATALIPTFTAAQVGQLTSVYKQLHTHNPAVTHPPSTLYTAYATLRDAAGGVYTVRLRNFKGATLAEQDLRDFFDNVAGTAGYTPLSAKVSLPNTGNLVSLRNVKVILRT